MHSMIATVLNIMSRKLLLYDNFNCWDEGCLVGPVCKEVIAQMRKSN